MPVKIILFCDKQVLQNLTNGQTEVQFQLDVLLKVITIGAKVNLQTEMTGRCVEQYLQVGLIVSHKVMLTAKNKCINTVVDESVFRPLHPSMLVAENRHFLFIAFESP